MWTMCSMLPNPNPNLNPNPNHLILSILYILTLGIIQVRSRATDTTHEGVGPAIIAKDGRQDS
jgi:hypothetical protein